MNNQEILQKIVAYIEAIMVDKSMTSRDLAEICAKRSGKMSPRTIDKMFKTPSSTTLSTLLKVCDGLDLNLNAVFHSIEIAKHQQRMGSNVLSMKLTIPLTTVIQETTMYFICQHQLTRKTMLTRL